MAGKKTKPSKAGKGKATKVTVPVNKKSLGTTIKEKLLGKSK
jgi:hypothetical protein